MPPGPAGRRVDLPVCTPGGLASQAAGADGGLCAARSLPSRLLACPCYSMPVGAHRPRRGRGPGRGLSSGRSPPVIIILIVIGGPEGPEPALGFSKIWSPTSTCREAASKPTKKRPSDSEPGGHGRANVFLFYVNYYYYVSNVTVAGVKRIAARVLGPRRFPVPYLASWYGMVA